MREISDKRFKRDDIVATYRFALISSEEIDWPVVNHAIIDRWSRSGLKYIKNKAWK